MSTPSETMADEASFLRAVRTTPIIDNHAHPLLRPAAAWTLPLLCITTEADGSALDATATSLPHLRAVKQLSSVLGCEPTWAAVSSVVEAKRRRKEEHEGWVRTCLSGIHSVLVDDKIGVRGDNESYDYFDGFTTAKAKRIVRIEHVATELIEAACRDHARDGEAFSAFVKSLRRAILEAWADPVVVGFKSAICYRTGLDIPRTPDQDKAFSAFCKIHRQRRQPGAAAFTRLDRDGLNQFLVHFLAGVMSESSQSKRRPKPMQFHTGLGDNDITLTKASPAHLQPFIKQYPSVPIVLLHSGYPFVRDAGYLATVYGNVYADIGEVFPMVSRDGEETIVRQMLELCPSSKILWSTDGHWFPETYLLAVMQMREAFETVLCGYVKRGDLTWRQATEVVENVLFHNSNRLYHLDMTMDTPLATPKTEPASPQPLLLESASPVPQLQTAFESIAQLLSVDPSIQFIRVCWQDMTGTLRARSVPIRRAQSLAGSTDGFRLSISQAAMAILQDDHLIEGASATGEWNLCADLRSLRPGPRSGHAMAMGEFKEKGESPVALCPRTVLRDIVERAASRGITFLLGFEVEFMLLRRTPKGGYDLLDADSHAWCTFDALDHPAATIIEEAVSKLASVGVHVETVHAESAPGQYEMVLPATTPLEAIDTLIYARSVLSSCAGPEYKVTLHPKPIPNAAGTAAHVHMSITSPGGSDPSVYEPFYAGILSHLRSILAFTCPNPVSYDRLVDGCWAGGAWVAWGTQNRETPLRKIADSHWELKCMDGLANPYLAMAAILGAGLEGIRGGREMEWKECVEDPASMEEGEREKLGVRERLPATLGKALDALGEDEVLGGVLGGELVDRYVRVKRGEIKAMEELEKRHESRWVWVVERY